MSGTREQRLSERYDFPSTIEYVVDSPTADRMYKAVTINVSDNGIGAYVFAPHSKGMKLIIKTPLPVQCRAATVRWIKKENDDFYLVGLQCNGHVPWS